MTIYPHLPLERLERTEDRRRVPAPVKPPVRESPSEHGLAIEAKIDAAAAEQAALPSIAGIDPELILKVTLAKPIAEDIWRSAGFKVLAQEQGNILVLFTDDTEMREFRERLGQYQRGTAPDRQNPAYNTLFASITDIGGVTAVDRIGPRLRSDGISMVSNIDIRRLFTVDLELWDAPTQLDREVRVYRLVTYIESKGGEVQSRYVGSAGLIILRVRMSGAVLREVLTLPAVARIDLRPVPDLGERDAPVVTLQDVPPPSQPPVDAPVIGVVDSGSTEHPFLVPVLEASLGIPEALGTADIWGHGTKVAGIAAFGDVQECVDKRLFQSPVRIISIKVVNDQGQFDDVATIPEQMQKAVRTLHARGCRIVNISLGDKHRIAYDGGRVSSWAATLDALARELDILIVVSAGNSAQADDAPWGAQRELITQAYPHYLVEPANRIIDPATSAIALTVGSLAHANGLPVKAMEGVELRAIASLNMPSPMTRSGPGANGSIKPDLVDFGGTCLFDGGTQRIVTGAQYASAGMLTLRPDYIQGLITSASGTSMAAPRVAYKAALLLRAFPTASANMIRAFLALSADAPAETMECLRPVGGDAHRLCLGYGVPDVRRALNSEERRVIFMADHQEIQTDQFALYRVPLPKVFQGTKGSRHIRVSLAYDPPVRHTRQEYLGVRLNYHLLRGMGPEAIYEHFRQRSKEEKPFDDLPSSAKCELLPSRDVRSTSTLQTATMTMKRNIGRYGDDYYLAVFAERRWAGEEITHQRFAVAVELQHEAEINIYLPLRVPVRA